MRLDHTESDCLVVIVMSHGTENGEVHAYDSAYQVSNLWRNFTGSSCPSLVGKPKLFFLQVKALFFLL